MAESRCLTLAGVCAWYGQAQVIWDVSFVVGARQFVGIVGRNGAGKTTLLRVIARLHGRASGSVSLFGREIIGQRPEQVARLGVGIMREGGGIFESLSVQDHLQLAAKLAAQRSREASPDAAWDWFPMLHKLRDAKGGYLSGGQRKMLGLAMAFVSRPSCLLLDEPSAGLAESVSESVFEVVERLAREDMALVVAEQDPKWLKGADRVHELEVGRFVQ
jgi:branched-chain amino acid transport system ATP-binding protein